MTTPATNPPIEETWWELTFRTGLILTLPAPLTSTGNVLDPYGALMDGDTVNAQSAITKQTYVYSLKDVALIKPKQITADPDRLARSLLRALGKSLDGSSPDSPAAPSPSSETANPTRRSRSAAGKRDIH